MLQPHHPDVTHPPSQPTTRATLSLDENYLNCPEPAFHQRDTHPEKARRCVGRKEPVADRLDSAQDTVFSNCAGKRTPITCARIAPTVPRFLRPTAPTRSLPQRFMRNNSTMQPANSQPSPPTTIRHGVWGDTSPPAPPSARPSPWGKPTDPYSGDLASYDPATMRRAQQMLEATLARPNPTPSRAIVQNELNFIRIRTEPEKRAAEICAALAGPASPMRTSLRICRTLAGS